MREERRPSSSEPKPLLATESRLPSGDGKTVAGADRADSIISNVCRSVARRAGDNAEGDSAERDSGAGSAGSKSGQEPLIEPRESKRSGGRRSTAVSSHSELVKAMN